MNTKEFESKKGITLVALVISILVLLILAGVTLQLAVGEDGIIRKAIVAREQHEAAEEMELIELAVSSAMVDGQGELTTENLNKELREQFGNEEEVKPTSVGWSYNGNKRYRIYNDGKVEHIIFQPVEYIESTGTQYIDTKYIPNQNTEIESIFEINKFGENAIIYGGELGYGNNACHLYRTAGIFDVGFGYQQHATKSFDINTKYITRVQKNKYYINGVEYNSSALTGTFSSARKIFIFALNRASILRDSNAQKKLYSMTITENNTAIREFLPCYTTKTVTDVDGKTCPSGTIGLYDLVEDQFYTNQGTGEFLKGEDV